MKKWLALCLLVFMLPLGAYAELSGDQLLQEARAVCSDLVEGRFDALTERFNAPMRDAVDAELLRASWAAITEQLGAYQGVQGEQPLGSNASVSFSLAFEDGAAALTVTFDETGDIAGLLLQPQIDYVAVEKPLPAGAQEMHTALFAGTERELRAAIVTPPELTDATPYVLLVHGSGASDMDETVGPNKPFRDIAYDLAALGVASMRFDKVNFAHPELPIETVEQEYLQPVREALRVLRKETGATDVYVAGHSEGGILTPWLVRECGFTGGIVLAGTPKSLWEMSYDQNLLSIELMPEAQRAELLQVVEAERARAESLLQMSDEEARAQTVFGVSAFYLRHMEGLDQIAIAQETRKPFLFLWGEADLQVNRDAFESWEKGLGESPLYAYVTYPGLSHLFIQTEEGDSFANLMQSYMRPATVDPSVAKDIADWIQSVRVP